jgi:hypothetical protein
MLQLCANSLDGILGTSQRRRDLSRWVNGDKSIKISKL